MSSAALISSETASWQTLLTLDRKSDAFTELARRLLGEEKTRKFEASQFTEEEAPKFIEIIEQMILKHPDIAEELKSTAFTVLQRLCGTFERLPKTCLIKEDFKTEGETPVPTCGYTDLWKRDWNGRNVAVKALRFGPDDDRSKIMKRFCKEVLLWRPLNHPNALPFYGVSMSQSQFCMVFPWMENGNVLSYTRKNPRANRLRLLADVASGLEFLRRMSLVHGNIRGSNILISDNQPPQALLGDFGLNTILFHSFLLTSTPIDWTAPELLTPDDTTYQPSFSSDIYALGMVIYEVLTGTPPFGGRGKIELACKVALEDERPGRRRDSEKLGFTNEVWEVLQKCWEREPSARPSADLVTACLKQASETWVADVPAFLLASFAGVELVMDMKRDWAEDFANELDGKLDEIGISQHLGETYLKYLQGLCGTSGVLPASFMLTDGFDDIEARPLASGGFADVYRATYKGQPVVVKALKTSPVDDLDNLHKRFAKEVVGWKWLRHENILPFVGVTSELPPFSMVSTWMENGNIMSFIRANPDRNPFNLLVNVTDGLQYLHKHDFVHGDLKGANILIDSERRACLADFGFAAIIGDTTSGDKASDNKAGGTIRWMAPEILNPERYGYVKRARRKLPSKSTDIYALGMTILEVVTGRRPFVHTNPDATVVQKVLSGIRPDRPSVGFSDALWTLLTQTWQEEFESSDPQSTRPNITNILERLQDEEKSWTPASRQLVLPVSVEQEINADDSEDVVPRGSSDCSSSSQPIPPLTPAPANWFFQTTSEILDLTDQVASVGLFGLIGVGKSFVARTVLDDGRTKAKFGEDRHFVRCDDLENSLERFIGRLSDAVHTDATQLESRLQSSPPLILLLDGIDSALDPLTPEAEEIYARIEEFGTYEHVCLLTTSRMYPDIHGFHRVEVPTPPEDGARDIFYGLSNLDRSPAVDTLIAKLDSHPFSIELLARSAHENSWDEQMLLKAWYGRNSALRTSYYQGLKNMIEPMFRSPMIKGLGTTALDVLEAVAPFQSGIIEHQLEAILRGTGGVREVVDVLCKFSLIRRQDGVLKMPSPLQFYFLESMLVYAETEEVIKWGPDCMCAPGVLPVSTRGPPDYLLSPATCLDIDPVPYNGPSHTTPGFKTPRKRKWMKRLPQIIKRKLLALFGHRITPTILINIQEDAANIPPTTLQVNPTNILPIIAQEDPAITSPATPQEDPADASPAAAQEELANLPPTNPQQQISPAVVGYEMD